MKLLLIIDNDKFIEKLSNSDTGFYFGNIQIDVIFLDKLTFSIEIKKKIQAHRYHLVLSITQGAFLGEFIGDQSWVNAVNNYLAPELQRNSFLFSDNDIAHPPLSIVNRTTSYFNVFLEIPKAVSVTTHQEKSSLDLQRLDVLSHYNYYLAYTLHEIRANYYLLSYKHEFPDIQLIDLLGKIE